MYPSDHASVWRVRKVYIKASASAVAVAEPLTLPIKLSAPLTELNKNSLDTLTTSLVTKLYCKHIFAEVNSDANIERVTCSDSETETEDEDNNHIGTTSLRYSTLPKKISRMECGQVVFV